MIRGVKYPAPRFTWLGSDGARFKLGSACSEDVKS